MLADWFLRLRADYNIVLYLSNKGKLRTLDENIESKLLR